MLKTLLAGIVIGVLLVFGGVWYYFASGRAPVAVTDPPLPFEEKLAHRAMHAHIDRQPHTAPMVQADETNLLAGVDVYRQNCAICHGLPGAPKSAIAEGMAPDPPQMFRGEGVTDDPAWETYWKAANGIRMTGMPGFKNRLTDVQMWQVAQLLATADKLPPKVTAALEAPVSLPPKPAEAGQIQKDK